MRSKSFDGMVCSIAGVLDAIGDRWAMLILRDLGLGLRRYDDLRKSTGVTHATRSSPARALSCKGMRRLLRNLEHRITSPSGVMSS